ncbi:MAG: hypothetical protein ACN6OP_09380 [Pseudomonadales bacterium]
MDQTLEELRAENAAAEAAAKPVPQTDEPEAGAVEAAGTTTTDDLAEGGEGEEGQQAEPEAWMKGDDQESQGADKKFTDSDIGAAKAKLRAKLEKQHQSELEELRAQLEKQRSESVPQQLPARPKREDFYDKDDPDEAYIDALADWKVKEGLAQQHANSQHYERAAVLAAASGISTELYQSADRRVREAVQGVFGGESGEHITNALIASLGEGSEKVLYNLGVSPKRLNELTSKLAQDPSGIQASIYLGKLSAELTSPPRKTSNAPAPAASVLGDANTTDAGKALQRKYLEAHKRGDVQAAFNIRGEAKAAKINVNSW